jgi:hypothetical protein
MAVTSSAPIDIGDLVTEFGGDAPHSLTEYYRGGSLVPNTTANASVPTSGAISLTNFFGATDTQTTGNYTIGIGGSFIGLGVGVTGFDANGQVGSFGSISTNTIDFSGFDVTIGGVYATSSQLRFYVTSHVDNSGWISMTLGGTTYNRTDASYAQANSSYFGGNYTIWTWSASNAIGSSGTITVSWLG